MTKLAFCFGKQADGIWEALWVSPNSLRWEYSTVLSVVISQGLAYGSNTWTVIQSPHDSWAGKSATEYLEGTYNYTTRLLELRGTSKDDPENIITLDAYQLTLSEDGMSLSGKSSCGGSWSVSDAFGSSRLFTSSIHI
jgi:hypothetical protein